MDNEDSSEAWEAYQMQEQELGRAMALANQDLVREAMNQSGATMRTIMTAGNPYVR